GKRPDGTMEGVFIWSRQEDAEFIVMADAILPRGRDAQDRPMISSEGLRAWSLDQDGCRFLTSSGSVDTSLGIGKSQPSELKRKATGSALLGRSDDPEDIAEFQWRLTRPLSVIVLGFLSLYLAGWSRPRGSRIWPVVASIVGCVGYYLVSLAARTWLRGGLVERLPGIYWVDATMALLLASLFIRARFRRVVSPPRRRR
ncbi:MAG: LptF/LptG family permease, partial [Planctomycetes bacterium]|nr:LptF/LptG family permease [Planctomycetota bacterium]